MKEYCVKRYVIEHFIVNANSREEAKNSDGTGPWHVQLVKVTAKENKPKSKRK